MIKTEIETVYLTSDDEKFLDEHQAIIHESELDTIRKQNRRWEDMKIELTEIVLEVLKNERWGIFFKNEPMQTLPVKDSATTFFKVNEVKEDIFVDAIKKQIESAAEARIDECQEIQTKNRPQTENRLLSGTEKTLEDTER